jgi:phenylacetate-coenzyme A ligase PaaK-like adenylate-forming protein
MTVYPENHWHGAVPNSVVLMFVRGWQGGTIHQIAAELGVTVQDILVADLDRMQDLMRLAQEKRMLDLPPSSMADVRKRAEARAPR